MQPFIASFIGLLALVSSQGNPEQVHLFFAGDESKMHVSFVTLGDGVTSESVLYGTSPDQLTNTATATSTVLTYNMTTPIRLHEADLVNLSPGIVYYAVGDPGSASAATVYNFTASPSRADGSMVYMLTADMGMVNGVDSGQVLEPMIQNMAAYDYWVMAGDFAYDMEDQGGELGNEFMRAVEPITASIPFQVVVSTGFAAKQNTPLFVCVCVFGCHDSFHVPVSLPSLSLFALTATGWESREDAERQ
jgi:hypothetical protein